MSSHWATAAGCVTDYSTGVRRGSFRALLFGKGASFLSEDVLFVHHDVITAVNCLHHGIKTLCLDKIQNQVFLLLLYMTIGLSSFL